MERGMPTLRIMGNPKPPRVGAFEVTTSDGKQYWSKLAKGTFPNMEEIAAEMLKDLAG